MQVEILVDRDTCIGSGQCVHWARGVFDQDDEAKAFVVDPRGETEERIVRAVTGCPVQAISLQVGGRRVGAEELLDWVRGVHSTDPIVSRLDQLCEEHHELQAAFAGAVAGEAEDAAEVQDRLSAHLRTEADVYPALVALVEGELVDAFDDDHAAIDRAAAALTSDDLDPADRQRALEELAGAVADHIRLEETVLFPLALAAVARR